MPAAQPTPDADTASDKELAAVCALAEPIAATHGVELVEVAWASDPKRRVLRVTIQRALGEAPSPSDQAPSDQAPSDQLGSPGGITLDDCVRVSRDLSTVLDVEEVVAGKYSLEVSSPGLDRPLRSALDYRRQLGKLAKVKLIEPAADGQHVLRGTIVATTDDEIEMEVDGNSHTIPIDNVREAKLVFELGSETKRARRSKTKKRAR